VLNCQDIAVVHRGARDLTIAHFIAVFVAFALVSVVGATGQPKGSAWPVTAPPKLAVLVYQRFAFDKMAESDRTLAAAAGACAKLEVPNSWIVLDSVSGEQEALSFDPFDSFAHINKAFAAWPSIYAAHSELGKLQMQINSALTSQRTVVAVRRDDLSYRAIQIDLSKARFLRVLEVRLHPGHEGEFAEAFQKLGAAYERAESDLPWVVYQGNAGMPLPAFFVFMPMKTLTQNDDLLNEGARLKEADTETAERMEQISREAFAYTETNLYAIRPDKSCVSKNFAAGAPEFWMPQSHIPKKATVGKSTTNKRKRSR
jgi:hypothetical protein